MHPLICIALYQSDCVGNNNMLLIWLHPTCTTHLSRFSSASRLDSIDWCPELGTRFIVVDRAERRVVGEFTAPAFYCFHQVRVKRVFERGRDEPTVYCTRCSLCGSCSYINKVVLLTGFHQVNAFDEDEADGGGVCIDLLAYEDAAVLHSFTMPALRGGEVGPDKNELRRCVSKDAFKD